jgi:niacin transporter
MTVGALMLAFGIVLPQLFHLTGIPQVGEVFLPMHIPVLLAGFLIGGEYGFAIGLLTPLISHFITEMPGTARLPFMMGELAIYGLVSGLLYHKAKLKNKKLGGLITLIASMVAGRLFYAAMLFVAASFLNIKCGGAIAAVTATVKGVYGIALQILVIPPIVYAAKKGGLIIDSDRKGKRTDKG